MKKELDETKKLAKSFGVRFRKKGLLLRAVTHKSFANERHLPETEHNERLEFLGDAVLELAVSQLLMERFPQFSEGDLSKLRAAIVNEKKLAELARRFEIGRHLRVGRGEEQTSGREKDSLLADAYEAILGAIYLDRGFDKASAVVWRHCSSLLDEKPVHHFYQDYKTEFQEQCQARFRAVPRYRLIAEHGPDHEKIFDVELYVRDRLMGRGKGKNKKEAEQQAAHEALENLQRHADL